ncbi:MAG: hypothetical protein CMF75_03490 [Maricaulis sp.]|nr:hypothetical protein [Maricaulis sp.]|tara:strand:- start:29 stop:571 length:543 start_codon:yes stop_codon:yes gene_type:complete
MQLYRLRHVPLALLAMICLSGLPSDALGQERRQLPDFTLHGEPTHAGDEAGLHAFVETFREHWAAQDTAALMEMHTPDTEWINAYARMFQGRDALGRFLEDRLFPSFSASVSAEEAANMRLVSLRFLGTDGAVIHLATDGQRGESRNAGEAQRRTHIHLVLQRAGTGWLIAHTAIFDARN